MKRMFRATLAGLTNFMAGAVFAGVAIAQPQSTDDFESVTDEMLQAPAPEDWLMWRRTLDSWGYSPLDQITKDNADELQMVWTRGLTDGFQSGTPLVHAGVMYMPNPNDVIQAIDASTGDLIWETLAWQCLKTM